MDGAVWVTWVTLGMSVICFILYVVQSVGLFSPKPVATGKAMAERARGLTTTSVPEMTDLLKATAALADSLGKIGPAVTSLIGAILFTTIAALATHALPGTEPKPTPPAKVTSAPAAKPEKPAGLPENAQQ
ncbi:MULTISPECIES: hypothetical protein [unclassified Mesorhizobium]|uniref:hypothetical protein n=1 Tax=unclassified Mesorhizobium TaxID=325217 RepID=UPI0003CFF89B|nr:hypothetical protein [Mesorhizobium sp. L103C131B0]ESZ64759.1 hypothetical protein X729_05575 [Mesorhizobium sp. L103C131B0]